MPSRNVCGAERLGFTLIELLVSLALGGVLLMGARAVLGALGDGAHALALRTAQDDAEANGLLMLQALVGRVEVGTASAIPFAGASDQALFTSWCGVPSGWLERCTVTLVVEVDHARRDTTASLQARVAGRMSVTVVSDVAPRGLRYLSSASNGGKWFPIWGPGVTAPLAIGVIRLKGARQDTLVVRIGERG